MTSLMDLQIAQLQARHRMTLPPPPALPLLDAVDHDVIVEGVAATHDLDFSRCSIAPFSMSWSTTPMPPLLYRHLPYQVAGKIDTLNLIIRAASQSGLASSILKPSAAPVFLSASPCRNSRSAIQTAR